VVIISMQADKRLEDANAPDRSKIAIISSMLLTNSDSARASVDSIPPLLARVSDAPDGGGDDDDDITTHVYHVRTADGRASWRHSIDNESLNRMLNEVATQLNVSALLPTGTRSSLDVIGSLFFSEERNSPGELPVDAHTFLPAHLTVALAADLLQRGGNLTNGLARILFSKID